MRNPSDVIDVSRLLRSHLGLRSDESAHRRLSRCVADEAARREIDVDHYAALLQSDAAAVQELVDRVTVQETAFFRDNAQLDAFRQHVLEALPRPFTLWSAGCANGQEAYSLAMLLEEAGIQDGRVFATDVSKGALERTRAGFYADREIGGLSAERRARFFAPVSDGVVVTDSLRTRVVVAHHNLMDAVPLLGPCPVVFCRNVFIYFGADEVAEVLDRFADVLPIGGWLFLGYSEALGQVSDRFELVRLDQAYVYRRVGDRHRSVPAPTRASKHSARPVSRPAARRPARVREPAGPDAELVGEAPAHPPDSRTAELLALGDRAMGDHDLVLAVTLFRQCVYLDPSAPGAQVRLGLALEELGDSAAARRAFAVARVALDEAQAAGAGGSLDGYPLAEFAQLLDRKLAERS